MLRTLSPSTTDPWYPQSMRTRAWAMKTLNTQLASWTQLRHDTILYVKQSATGVPICDYPDGFVEPRPDFFFRLEKLAHESGDLLAGLPSDGLSMLPDFAAHFQEFAATARTLAIMAQKELLQFPFDDSETTFIRGLIQANGGYCGMVPERTYSGWYPKLFYGYKSASTNMNLYFHLNVGAGKRDQLAADIHTDFPCPDCGDPGAIIHEGVGDVDLLIIAVDNGPDRMIFAGPVLSHYEFEQGPNKRLTDEEWRITSPEFKRSALPEWTRSFLVP